MTLSSLTIRPATAADAEPLVALLAEAFADDALTVWAFPDPVRRRQILPGFFRAFYDLALAQRGTYTTDDRQAVVLATPPGAADPGEAFARRLAAAAGEYADALMTIVDLQELYHPASPRHLYLGFGAVSPERQQTGLASAVMAHLMEECDRDGTPAYLEASSAGGAAVARRFGFEPHGPLIHIPGGPQLRPMWRDPR
ncbi:GNAT family N-acetyltransferase [Nonomuraea sp. NPDC050536]|uniref:GNAT family N-acetyltransferase n=1 Tax=Nonomuraea sp. NPDC050536 TaxID=3364366 RepID=UPI0037C62E7D